jgi:cytidine deaminase
MSRNVEDALSPELAGRLTAAAHRAREHAHAPYSRFRVGAALLDEHGRIHAGCNIENAAYPQGLCAEAAALAHLVMAGGKRVCAVAVAGDVPQGITPCGGCRQKLREFAGENTPVLACDLQGERVRYSFGFLLPASFGPEQLDITRSGDDPR